MSIAGKSTSVSHTAKTELWGLGKLTSIIAVASTPPSGTPVHKGLELQDKRLDIQLYHRTLKQVNRKT